MSILYIIGNVNSCYLGNYIIFLLCNMHNDGNYFFVCFVPCISRLSVFEFHLKELLTI